mgnify:CR=1 FL=1
MRITLSGDIHYALSHFALYGAAAILEHELATTARVRWVTPDQSEISLSSEGLTEEQVADALHAHAVRHVDSWVQAVHAHRTGKKVTTVGTLSPRMATPADSASWSALQSARQSLIDTQLHDHQWLDLAFIHALGEPSYWNIDQTGALRPDLGASGWEMKTRNRGEEFVQNRLARLAASVAGRKPKQVLDGLTGAYFNDEVGKNAADSRTPTGLRNPQPTDNALAWMALWGISLFPVLHRASSPSGRGQQQGAPSITTAQLGRNMPNITLLRRRYTVLPELERPTRLSTLRSVLVSAALSRLAATAIRNEPATGFRIPDPRSPSDQAWLRAKGISGLLLSVVTATDNPNAPELSVDRGRLVVLQQ